MKYLLFLSLLTLNLLFYSCQNTHSPRAKQKENETSNELEREANRLVHCVFLNVKNDLIEQDRNLLIKEIEILSQIPQVHDLEVGLFTDLGDQRAMSKLELVFTMAFKNEADYKAYQQHEIHLALKANIGKYLEGPPVSYDYLIQ